MRTLPPVLSWILRWSLIAAFALMLAACGSTARKGGGSKPGGIATGKNATGNKGGGYYKDDGPGDDIPDNLDDIPDAVPRLEPIRAANSRPYTVLGKTYVPYTSLRPYKERGVASWYGKKFHGEKTSIGEPYNMYAMTAAHTLLALPSYVRVTNLSNGRSVVVRVTDRGPFHAGRVIDLSYTAAWKLGLIGDGSGKVEVEAIVPGKNDVPPVQVVQEKTHVIPVVEKKAEPIAETKKPASTTPATIPAPASSPTLNTPGAEPAEGAEGDELAELVRAAEVEADALSRGDIQTTVAPGVYIQLGAFSNADNASTLRAHLRRELDWVTEPITIYSTGNLLRVQLGPYPSRGDAERVAEKIRALLGYRPTYASY